MTAERKILSDAQLRLATAVLDVLIPRDGNHPGAGEMGGAKWLDATIVERPEIRRLMVDALQAIATAAGDGDFVTMETAAQTRILRAVESSDPGVFDELVKQTYNLYYTDPDVRCVLGFTPENPQPFGHPEPEPFDTSLLDGVRARNRSWRRV